MISNNENLKNLQKLQTLKISHQLSNKSVFLHAVEGSVWQRTHYCNRNISINISIKYVSCWSTKCIIIIIVQLTQVLACQKLSKSKQNLTMVECSSKSVEDQNEIDWILINQIKVILRFFQGHYQLVIANSKLLNNQPKTPSLWAGYTKIFKSKKVKKKINSAINSTYLAAE